MHVLHIYAHCHGGGARVTCLDFGYGRAAGVPRPHPIHITKLSEKYDPHPYTYYSEIGTYSYIIFHILHIHILFE